MNVPLASQQELNGNVNMNYNEEVPDFLGGLGDMLPADVLKKVNELLERVHRKDKDHQGSPVFIYAPGSQYVDTQINIGETLPVPPCVGREKNTEKKEDIIKNETPLSALFRENHHEKLRKVIDSWRPYLIGGDASVNALAMTRFEFNKERIYSNKVYRDLCELDTLGALQVSLSQLARYLSAHSNLSRSYATLYQQLKNYRNEYVTYSP